MLHSKKPSRPDRWLVLAAVAVTLASGCSNSDVDLGPVRGTVTMDDQPLPEATVRFIPIGGGRTALGRTDAQGRYEIQYSATATGALVGPVRVEITTAEEYTDRFEKTQLLPETVPARYNVDSELEVEVGRESNVFDFHLKSK